MANAVYNNYKRIALQGQINVETDTINVLLMNTTYVPDIDTEAYYSDIILSGGELPLAGNYVTSGSTVTVSTSANITNDYGVLNFTDVVYANATFNTGGALVYKKGGTPATSPLMFFVDFGVARSTSSEEFKIAWNPAGALQLS